MKCVVILVLAINVYGKVTLNDYNDHLNKYEKKDVTDVERFYRFQIFKRNAKRVDKLNSDSDVEYRLNAFADLTDEEFETDYFSSNNEEIALAKRSAVKAPQPGQGPPSSFDWRFFGAITPPSAITRLNGGNVWPAVAVMEAAYFRATGNLIAFSSEEISDCWNDNSYGAAFDYIKFRRGLSAAATYKSQPGVCASGKYPNVMTGKIVDKYTTLEKSDYALINAMMRVPILATMKGGKNLAFYSGGIFPISQCESSIMATAVVGYAPRYYILKNAWGKDWGEKGYMRLERRAEINSCGLFNAMLEPSTELAE